MSSEGLFLDSAYPIALVSRTDQYHNIAMTIASSLAVNPENLFTTRAILLEIGNALARPQFRSLGVELLKSFETDPDLTIISLDEALYKQGFDLFDSRPDKTWSLTDCISFVTMKEHGLKQALTSDQHFEQAGFVALLRK